MESARALDYEIPYTVEKIDQICRDVVKANNLSDCYIRPVAWRGSEQIGVSAQATKIHLSVAAWEWGSYFPLEQRLKGIRLTMAKYRRPDPKTAPCKSKAAGLYMICTIEKHRAEAAGYADALMLDWRGHVAECTGANIFFVKDGVIHTPDASCFLDGITRRTVIELAKKRGYEIVERTIMPEELADFSEAFLTGTAAEVTPVSEIDEHRYTPGKISENLLNDYMAYVQPARKAAE
jgi:branched-chain amino acid aminotransferase